MHSWLIHFRPLQSLGACAVSLLYFSGAPGHHKDLEHLFNEGDWKTFEPKSNQSVLGSSDSQFGLPIWMGYSFGCQTLLVEALKSPQVPKALLLVSPYIPQKAQNLRRILLSLPLIGQGIVSLKRTSIINELSRKTCFPQSVSAEFQKVTENYTTQVILKSALQTSNPTQLSIKDLKNLFKKVPTFILYGEQDQTSNWDDHVKPLLPEAQLEKIQNGGHGLFWTHRKEVLNWFEKCSKGVLK
jgi:pimeloyl-ACP methyl ester carboxylesterase